MKGFVLLAKGLWAFFKSWKSYLPIGFVIIYSLFSFIGTIFTEGALEAFKQASILLFAAEKTIFDAVTLAVANDPAYTPFVFLAIFNSCLVIYLFVKWITKFLVGISGSQAVWGAVMVAIVIYGIIEVVAVYMSFGEFGFFPIKDGVLFLLLNLKPVFSNINWTWFLTTS